MNNISGSIWTILSSSSLWPLATIDFLMDLLNKCLQDIEPLRNSDPARFNVLNDRLRRERLTPIYLLLKNYSSYISHDLKVEYVNDLAKYTLQYEILGTGEGYNDMANLVNEWKKSL